jgi:hypothetical protein
MWQCVDDKWVWRVPKEKQRTRANPDEAILGEVMAIQGENQVGREIIDSYQNRRTYTNNLGEVGNVPGTEPGKEINFFPPYPDCTTAFKELKGGWR